MPGGRPSVLPDMAASVGESPGSGSRFPSPYNRHFRGNGARSTRESGFLGPSPSFAQIPPTDTTLDKAGQIDQAPNARNPAGRKEAITMTTRWGSPVLLAGLIALISGSSAYAGHFGTTNYSASTHPTCCAQTHFTESVGDPGIQTVGYTTLTETVLVPVTRMVHVDEVRTEYKTVNETVQRQVKETELRPFTTTVMRIDHETATRPVYENHLVTVTELVSRPVVETVMKECRSTVSEQVVETRFKDCARTVSKQVCQPVTETYSFHVSRPVCTTVMQESSRTVCKEVTETLYKECPQTVCTPVTERVLKDVARVEMKEVPETVMKDVVHTVTEEVPCVRTVSRTVPETVLETVYVPGNIAWKTVPIEEDVTDPATGKTVRKQTGSTVEVVQEASYRTTREVTRDRTIIEQMPDVRLIHKTVVEKVPTTVMRKVATLVHDTVAVEVTRNVASTQMVKVPYTVTKTVPVAECVRVPVKVSRNAIGAYVDIASLTGDAADRAARGEEMILNAGHTALSNPAAATYDKPGPGRVFLEGIPVIQQVTRNEVKTIAVEEVRKVPYQVVTCVPREVVKQVPTTVTRMVQTPVTRQVSVPSCRLVTEQVCKMVPTQVMVMRPEVVTRCYSVPVCRQVKCTTKVKVARTITEMVPTTVCKVVSTPCSTCSPAPVAAAPCNTCSPAPAACSPCIAPCGPTCGGAAAACRSCDKYTGHSGIRGLIRDWVKNPCRPHPLRDFFQRMKMNRVSCAASPLPCSTCSAPAAVTPPQLPSPPTTPAPKAIPPAASSKPQTLPPASSSKPQTLPPAASSPDAPPATLPLLSPDSR
jgi:hypothetical protein